MKTDSFEVKKYMQEREHVSKKDVPLNVWTQYCKKSSFSVLALKPLKSAKAKGKAKAKAKAKGSKKRQLAAYEEKVESEADVELLEKMTKDLQVEIMEIERAA